MEEHDILLGDARKKTALSVIQALTIVPAIGFAAGAAKATYDSHGSAESIVVLVAMFTVFAIWEVVVCRRIWLLENSVATFLEAKQLGEGTENDRH